ncbi:MAG: thioredoxin [Paludibacteraceae bacterium]|nr:thioredoxin [Paludibacteraceae bacterium]MBQ4032407.1 thioredoxin [Paludibacteraceae bacterium]MBQ5524867.1 thioredoxin [Paludibacteraceae bacterium]
MKKVFVIISLLAMWLGAMAQEHITTQDFKNKVWDYSTNKNFIVLNSKLPVVLDFYADWCRPCKMVAPELTQLQKEYKGKILVYKINIDQEKELAQVFGIQSIPTIFFIKGDGKYTGLMGYRTNYELKQVVDSFFFNIK